MKRILFTITALLISLTGFSQEIFVLGGTSINKSFSGADTTVFHKVRNNGTALSAYMLVQNGDTTLLKANGDTLYIQKPDTSNPIFNLIEGDLLVRDSIKIFNHTTRVWEPISSGGGGTLDQAYDFGGAGLGREIDATDGAVKISGTDGFIVTGEFGSGADSEWVGAGAGMFFNPKKAAFRAGSVSGTEWDDANIGDYSVSLGRETTASGSESTAFGSGSVASETESTAFGLETTASGQTSTAMGESTTASGVQSTAMGESTTASGTASTSTGSGTIASGDNSLSTGTGTTASGNSSTSMGHSTTAKSFAETAIGLYNTDYTPTSTSTWEATDRLFVIGNGQTAGTRSDALIITKNGNLTMPTTTGAFTPPVLTTTERNSLTPTAGMVIYNSTDSKHQGYDGSTWNDFY